MEQIYFPVERVTLKLKDGWLPSPPELRVSDIRPSELFGYRYLEIRPRRRYRRSTVMSGHQTLGKGKNLAELFKGDYILIPEPHLSSIGLDPDSKVTILGLEDHFDVWNPDYLNRVNAKISDELYKLGV